LPIDELSYDFEIMNNLDDYDLANKPENGFYAYGFYLDGASWDLST